MSSGEKDEELRRYIILKLRRQLSFKFLIELSLTCKISFQIDFYNLFLYILFIFYFHLSFISNKDALNTYSTYHFYSPYLKIKYI